MNKLYTSKNLIHCLSSKSIYRAIEYNVKQECFCSVAGIVEMKSQSLIHKPRCRGAKTILKLHSSKSTATYGKNTCKCNSRKNEKVVIFNYSSKSNYYQILS